MAPRPRKRDGKADPEVIARVATRLLRRVDRDTMQAAVAVALLPAAQVRLLDLLRSGPATAREIAEETGIEQPIVARDLRRLHEAGWVHRRVYPRGPHESHVADEWSLLRRT